MVDTLIILLGVHWTSWITIFMFWSKFGRTSTIHSSNLYQGKIHITITIRCTIWWQLIYSQWCTTMTSNWSPPKVILYRWSLLFVQRLPTTNLFLFLWIYLSILDISCKWNYTVSDFLCLCFFHFYDWIIFYWESVPHFIFHSSIISSFQLLWWVLLWAFMALQQIPLFNSFLQWLYNLTFPQQYTRAPIAPHPHQHFSFSVYTHMHTHTRTQS